MLMRVGCYFAGGDAFWVGSALLVVACLLRLSSCSVSTRRVSRWLLLLGVPQVVLSATPLPWWLWVAGAVMLVGLVGGTAAASASASTTASHGVLEPAGRAMLRLRGFACGLFACLIAAVSLEFAACPRLAPPLATVPRLCVIGDSLSAGLYDTAEEPTWPRQFHARYNVEVIDVSRQGATTQSALEQARQLPEGPAVVLIEIGGNDMLEGVPSAEFRQALTVLLQTLHRDDRRLVMCELPRPPFHDGYGRAQRELAHDFGVQLIPRRELAGILAQAGTTEDGLHLSPRGHELLADVVWAAVGDWLQGTSGP